MCLLWILFISRSRSTLWKLTFLAFFMASPRIRNDVLSSFGDSGCIEHCPPSCDSLKKKGSFWLIVWGHHPAGQPRPGSDSGSVHSGRGMRWSCCVCSQGADAGEVRQSDHFLFSSILFSPWIHCVDSDFFYEHLNQLELPSGLFNTLDHFSLLDPTCFL